MKKTHKIVLGLVPLLLALGGAGAYAYAHRHLESTDNAYVRADLSPVTSRVEGVVTTLVNARDNGSVKKGEVLLVLDSRDYLTRVGQLEAQLAAKTAVLRGLEAQVGVLHSERNQAEATLKAREADARRAGSDAHRFESLLREQYATAQRAESARAEADKAQADVAAASARVSIEDGQQKALSRQIERARAELDESQAQLAQARNNLADTVIRAPVDGVVGNRSVQTGTLVKPGAQLLVLMQPASLYVQANFKETQVTRMRPGQPVAMHVDAYPDVAFTGVVDSLSPASGAQFSLLPQDNATGNFTKIVQRLPVKVRLTGPADFARLLKPGLSVVAEVDTH